jgi:uncharacterized protein (TIGR02594 family)
VTPEWYEIAKHEIGTAEVAGPDHNQRILEYHATTTLKATDDETPWCSSFVNWCIYHAGLMPTRSAAARSWLMWGIHLPDPTPGCIAVFRRGSSPTAGHVAFYVEDAGDKVRVLGGNQADRVSYARYAKADLLGYRWPDSIG